MSPPAQFSPVRETWPDVEYWEEAGIPYVHFPVLRFPAAGQETAMAALLCPRRRDGYDTRLFLEQQISGRGQNWKRHTIRGRAWWTFSWGGVSADLPWEEILANHLRALQ